MYSLGPFEIKIVLKFEKIFNFKFTGIFDCLLEIVKRTMIIIETRY